MADLESGELVNHSVHASTGSSSHLRLLCAAIIVHKLGRCRELRGGGALLLTFFNLFLLFTVRSSQVIRCLRYHDILRIPVLIMKKMRQRESPMILWNRSWKKHLNTILSVDIGPNTTLFFRFGVSF